MGSLALPIAGSWYAPPVADFEPFDYIMFAIQVARAEAEDESIIKLRLHCLPVLQLLLLDCLPAEMAPQAFTTVSVHSPCIFGAP